MRVGHIGLVLAALVLSTLAVYCNTLQSARDIAVTLSGTHPPQDRYILCLSNSLSNWPVARFRGIQHNFDLGRFQHPDAGCRRDSNLLLVTLLDGNLLALDPDAGTISWTLDLGSPLLSSSGIWFENSPDNEDPVSNSILPGADGSLYIFTDALGTSQALQVVHDPRSLNLPI